MVNSNKKPAICVPAMLYLILAVIGFISMAFQSCGALCLLFNVLFIAIWTWFLNFLCTQGYTTISWILVLLPFIIFILMILFAFEVMKKLKIKESFNNELDNCKKNCDENKKLCKTSEYSDKNTCQPDYDKCTNKCNTNFNNP